MTRKAKEHGVQWQLNRSYCLTCTPGHEDAQFNRHGNCATAKVDTVVLGECQAACVSKITVELTTFLPCSLTSETEYNGECCGCFTAFDVKRSRSMASSITLYHDHISDRVSVCHTKAQHMISLRTRSLAGEEGSGHSYIRVVPR